MSPVTSLLLAVTLAIGAFLQAPDRSKAPTPGPLAAFTPPPIVKRTLSNGLPVWIVEMHKVPVAHVTIVVKAGAGADPAKAFGLASLTADLLDEGAGSRGALEIADAVDYLGASLTTSSSFDSSTVDLHVPAARLGDALSIMADVVLRPTFPERELERVRQELLASIVQAKDDPESVADLAFPRLVYGTGHRYGTATFGTATSVKGFTAADLRQFHARVYVPTNALAIVSGDIAADRAVALLESSFGSWKGAAAAAAAVPAASQVSSRQVFLIDVPGAAQSQIRIGGVGVPRSTPEYFALRALNTVLGGAFTSRLNTNLREEHGYAYGASSTFEMRAAAGPFHAGGAVQTDKTAESITEFLKELSAIRKPITAGELEKAKNYLSLLVPRNFETTGSVTAALEPMFVYNLPDDFFATYTQRVRAVTQADLVRAAERYIQPDKFLVLVVGDRKTIEPGLKALNLGPIKVVTVDDVVK